VCNRLDDPWELIKKDREVNVRGDVTVYRALGYSWYVYHGVDRKVVLEDVELFDRLRRVISGKERTPRAKADLMAMCRRLANKNDIISVHQGFAHEVPPELMVDYVEAAFYADVQHELEVALAYHRENRDAVKALNDFITSGKTPVDLTAIKAVGRAVAEPFTLLAGLIHDHTVGARLALMEGRPLPGDLAKESETQALVRRRLVETLNKDAMAIVKRKSGKQKG